VSHCHEFTPERFDKARKTAAFNWGVQMLKGAPELFLPQLETNEECTFTVPYDMQESADELVVKFKAAYV